MLQTTKSYYNRQELPHNLKEHLFGVRAVLEEFLKELLFPEDQNADLRLLWADPSTHFVRRYEQIEDLRLSDPADPLQVPYICYYRDGTWMYDQRTAGQQMTSVMRPIRWGSDGGILAHAMFVERTFNLFGYFATEYDAQVAQELLLWLHNRPHHRAYKMSSGGKEFDVPVAITIEASSVTPESQLTDYVKQQKLSRLAATIHIRTPLLRMDPDAPPVVLTESVVWYFHNKNWRALPEDQGPQTQEEWEALSEAIFEIEAGTEGTDPPPEDPAGNGGSDLIDISFTTPSPNSARFTWDYFGVTPDYITFFVHKGHEIDSYPLDLAGFGERDALPTEQMITDLESSSVHDVRIEARWGDKQARSYHYSIETPDNPELRKGLAGLTGTTL